MRLVRTPRVRGADDELTARGGDFTFPAGVVALGRGEAGEAGALRRADGRLVGLLRLAGCGARGGADVAALATALPAAACQLLTVRRPVDLERQVAAWSAATAGAARRDELAALADHIADEYLPELAATGWNEGQTFLALLGDHAETLRRELVGVAGALPCDVRPATPGELKRLAGDWFAPLGAGEVALGWAVTELTAEPRPDWARVLLGDPALARLPLTLTLHLGPARDAAPGRPEIERRLAALDAEIEVRRRAGRRAGTLRSGDEPVAERDLLVERRDLLRALAAVAIEGEEVDGAGPRRARLLLACTVTPERALEVRGLVEAALHRLGFLAGSLGPGRGFDTLLSCAPLGRPVVGRDLVLAAHGAAILAPLAAAPATDGVSRSLPPLGLGRDGGALGAVAGEHLLLAGGPGAGKSSAARTWALARAATGAAITVIDTAGVWGGLAVAGGGARVAVGAHLDALLGGLGFDPATGGAEDWVSGTARLLDDLCPTLSDDDRGDLTATLLALADDGRAGRDQVRLGRLIGRLRRYGADGAADALAALLPPASAPRPWSTAAAPPVLVLDAAGASDTLSTVTPAGLAAAATRAAIERLRRPLAAPRGHLLILDDLAAVLAASAGPALLAELLEEARRAGATVWCVTAALPAIPRPVVAALRDLDAAAVLFCDEPEGLRATARWLGLPATLVSPLQDASPGEALVVRGTTRAPVRILASPLLDGPLFHRRGVQRRERRAAAVGAVAVGA